MKIFVPLLDNGNGSVMASFMGDFFYAFRERDVVFALASDSHANRGMNKIANGFLKTDCDAWFNIDADIRFRKQDVDNLIEHIDNDVALVYGIYPKKEEATTPCLCSFQTIEAPDVKTGLTTMRRSGRGFMLVRRDVLEAMKEDNGGPALRYHNHRTKDGERVIEWDFFPSGCVTGFQSALDYPGALLTDEAGFPVREWISEDWYFCERARALGYPTFVDARIALGHVGLKEYRFNSDQVTRFDSHIATWRDIHGWFDYEDFYRELAAKLPAWGKFVEVGCWMGKSIAFMAEVLKTLKKSAALHVVDTFTGAPANETQAEMLEVHGGSVETIFRENMKALGIHCVTYGETLADPDKEFASRFGAAQWLMVHREKSDLAAAHFADESLDAVFIDGDHSMEAVYDDILAWLPKVKPGGILCGHDIDEPGVAAAVKTNFPDFSVKGRCWIHTKKALMSA
jgi:SAM-dependent methyltransferase